MQENRTITIIHDTRYDRGDGKYPLKLRITFKMIRDGKSKWEQKYITSDHYLTVDEFRTMSTTKDSIIRSVRKDMEDLKAKAEAIKGYMTPDKFMATFTGAGNLENVFDYFDKYIKYLDSQGRIKTCLSYQSAASNFKAFVNPKHVVIKGKRKKGEVNPYLSFIEITVQWLKDFEAWGLKGGLTINSIGIYLRNLRAIFNMAIDDEVISENIYPFGRRRKFKIAKKKKTKWAPTGVQKDAILAYQTDDLKVRWGLDMYIFSYYCAGMNPVDMAHLRFSKIKGDIIEYERTKTTLTERDKSDISINLLPRAKEIMIRWQNKTLDPNAYIFPILKPGMTARQIRLKIDDFIKDVNEVLKPVGEALKIPRTLSFGIARHMYATTMKRAGVATKIISEKMGHSREEVTENYLHSFEDETIQQAASHL